MWKDVPVLFFSYKQVEKRGTQAWKSTPTPSSPSLYPQVMLFKET